MFFNKTVAYRILFFVGTFFQAVIFSYYGYLPDNMKFYDAIALRAHNSQSLNEMEWNIPNQYGNFYDLMKKYGVRSMDLRVYLGTDEVAALAPLHDVGNFFSNLFSGQPLDKPREKPRALITCHEHDKYYENCYFTRLIMKKGVPTKIEYFLAEMERFLRNNPSEFLVITFGMYMDAKQGNEVNGWKGKTQADVNKFFDNLLRNSGLVNRVVAIPKADTTIGELRGKVVLLGSAGEVVHSLSYMKLNSDMFKIELWGQFPASVEKGACALISNNPNALGFEATLHPDNPFDVALAASNTFLKDFLKLVTGSTEFTPYNYSLQVNTADNIRKVMSACQTLHKQKVNVIGMDFVSKGTPKIPAAVLFDVNKERLAEKGLAPKYPTFEAFTTTLK